jgi:hypothetical protein
MPAETMRRMGWAGSGRPSSHRHALLIIRAAYARM